MTVPVTFTQFLRPDGRRQSITIDMPDDVGPLVAELTAAGWKLEIEVLREGSVHADVCNSEEQLAVVVVPNGPEVPGAIETMLREAYQAWVELKASLG